MPLPNKNRKKEVLQEIVTEAPAEVTQEPEFLQEVVEPENQIPEEAQTEIKSKYSNLKFK